MSSFETGKIESDPLSAAHGVAAGQSRAAGSSPGRPTAVPNESELLKAVQRRWLLAVTFGTLLAAVVGVPAWFLVPATKYVGRSMLHINPRNNSLPGLGASEGIADFANYLRTQKLIITSRLVLNRALKDKDVGSLDIVKAELDPAEWLEKKLVVDFAAPEIITISLKGENAEELVKIVGAVTKAYEDESEENEKTRRLRTADRLRILRDDYETKLRTWRTQYRNLAKRVGLDDPRSANYKFRLTLDELAAAKIDLAQAKSQRYKLEAETVLYDGQKKDAKNGAKADPIPDSLVDAELKKSPEYQLAVVARDQQKAKLKHDESMFANDKTGIMEQGHEKLKELDAKVEAKRKELRAGIEKDIRDRLTANTLSIASEAKRKLAVQKNLEERLTAVVKTLTDETKDISESSIDLKDLESQIALFDTYLAKVSNDAEAIRIELEAPPRVTDLEKAIASRTYDIKKQILAGGLSGLAAFAIGVLAIGWREYRARRIKSGEEIVNTLGMRLVGALPALPQQQTEEKQAGGKSNGSYNHNQLVEHVDAARARLLHAARVSPFRTLLITSAASGEGKTSLASHLAASLARAGRRTLLLDCDLRRPSAHILFDLPSAPGFCEVLRGEMELQDVLQQTFLPTLTLVPGGKWSSQASQALAQEDFMRNLLGRLKEQYDFIIVDSSPVLAVADALWLAQYVDAAVFAILYEVSHMPSVQAAYHELSSLGTRILGAVIGGAPPSNAYGYQYAQYSANYYGNPG
jgi:polysaccharide biosynthesis transport protein